MSPKDEAILDVHAVVDLREALRNLPVVQIAPGAFSASEDQQWHLQERLEWVRQQQATRDTLTHAMPLYRRRLTLVRPDDEIRVFLSSQGVVFPAFGDDDILASWANPRFAGARTIQLGETTTVGPVEWKLIAATELSEELPDGLRGLRVSLPQQESVEFYEVRRLPDGEAEFLNTPVKGDVDEPVEEAPRHHQKPKSNSLSLDTIVETADGDSIEIPFALDKDQWDALTRQSSEGTIVVVGPPGTGKTTIALLRATTFAHTLSNYDEQGRLKDETPASTLRKEHFRVFVVTDNLRAYLKDFISSREVALPEAKVVNLRGTFMESCVRHKTLRKWIAGVRFRMSVKANQLSDALEYIKSQRSTLHSCFERAWNVARSTIGDDISVFRASLEQTVLVALEEQILRRLLGAEGYMEFADWVEHNPEGDIDNYLGRVGVAERFREEWGSESGVASGAVSRTCSFLSNWRDTFQDRVNESRHASDEVWLLPGDESLLLTRFIESLPFTEKNSRLRHLFTRVVWPELMRLIEPKAVLLDVVGALLEDRDEVRSCLSGLNARDVDEALEAWRSTLLGSDVKRSDGGFDVDDENNSEDLEADGDDLEAVEDEVESQAKGAFTRSDFPLLAGLARVFLAKPHGMEHDSRYDNVGFLLPDDLTRYAHIIVDEAQDFTYPEIQFVRSLVEPTRHAVTISGDPFQRMEWRYGFESLEELGVPPERTFTIVRNYRQTVELAQWVKTLATRLFPEEPHEMESGSMHGAVPILKVETDNRKRTAVLAGTVEEWFDASREPFVAVLLLGFSTQRANRLTRELGESLEHAAVHVEQVRDGRLLERGRVAVTRVPVVKGLEFDAVAVVVAKSVCRAMREQGPEARVLRNQLYVGCSRAKKNLVVVLEDECELLSELVSGA